MLSMFGLYILLGACAFLLVSAITLGLCWYRYSYRKKSDSFTIPEGGKKESTVLISPGVTNQARSAFTNITSYHPGSVGATPDESYGNSAETIRSEQQFETPKIEM